MQDIINYDEPLEFQLLRFEADDDDNVDFVFVSTDPKADAGSETLGRSPPQDTIRKTFIWSDLCALSHFTDATKNIVDQEIEILKQ
jgi:hypothetical protein